MGRRGGTPRVSASPRTRRMHGGVRRRGPLGLIRMALVDVGAWPSRSAGSGWVAVPGHGSDCAREDR